jgi:hypothetical protein
MNNVIGVEAVYDLLTEYTANKIYPQKYLEVVEAELDVRKQNSYFNWRSY